MIEKLITKQKIDKKVDPGVSLKNSQEIIKSIDPEFVVSNETDLQTLVQDNVSVIDETTSNLTVELANLTEQFSEDPIYSKWIQALEQEPLSELRLQTIERDIYTRTFEPKAMFYRDLYNVKRDLEQQSRVYTEVWKELTNTQSLLGYKAYDPLIYYAVYKDKIKLLTTKDYVSKVSKLKSHTLTDKFIDVFINKIYRLNVVRSKKADLSQIINQLRALKLIFDLNVLDYLSDWEQISQGLYKLYKDVTSRAQKNIIQANNLKFFGNFFDTFQDFDRNFLSDSDLSYLLSDIPEFQEINRATNRFFSKNLGKVEEFLIAQNVEYEETLEARNLLLKNSYLNVKYKKISRFLSDLITILETFELTYNTIDDFKSIGLEYLRNSLKGGVNNQKFEEYSKELEADLS